MRSRQRWSAAISLDQLMDEKSRNPAPIRSNISRLCRFTDRSAPIQDPIQRATRESCFAWHGPRWLSSDPQSELPQPQGPDPVWNNAIAETGGCSTIAVRKVAANTKPFLLQTTGDMAAQFRPDERRLLAIHIRGRHWGLPHGLPQS